ncbi:IncI1 shufflon protein [Escherichia coli]|nr:IncI1 shufflon protein [Escherichia coli]
MVNRDQSVPADLESRCQEKHQNSDQLDAVLLSSGGQAMDYPTLRYIAAAIDGYGGFVYSGSMPSGCTSSTTTVNGAACGWTLDLSGFGISTTSGHIAVNLGADIAGSAQQRRRLSAPLFRAGSCRIQPDEHGAGHERQKT